MSYGPHRYLKFLFVCSLVGHREQTLRGRNIDHIMCHRCGCWLYDGKAYHVSER